MRNFKGTMLSSQPEIIKDVIEDKEDLDAIGVHYEFNNVDPTYHHVDYTLSVDTGGYDDAIELHENMCKNALKQGIVLIITTEEV